MTPTTRSCVVWISAGERNGFHIASSCSLLCDSIVRTSSSNQILVSLPLYCASANASPSGRVRSTRLTSSSVCGTALRTNSSSLALSFSRADTNSSTLRTAAPSLDASRLLSAAWRSASSRCLICGTLLLFSCSAKNSASSCRRRVISSDTCACAHGCRSTENGSPGTTGWRPRCSRVVSSTKFCSPIEFNGKVANDASS